MPGARRNSPDSQAASTQLKTADQSARVPRDKRAKAAPGGDLVIKLRDKEFRLAEDVGLMPLMEWAAAADVDVASADGLRAVFYVLKDAVHPDEWAEFRKYSRDEKVQAEELLDFANAALEALAGRPTEEPSGS